MSTSPPDPHSSRTRWLRALALPTLALLTALCFGTWRAATVQDLPTLPDEPVWHQPLPAAHPPAGLRFAVMRTGETAGTPEALLVHMAVLVQHPHGSFLFDTVQGTQVTHQFAANTWLDRQFFWPTAPSRRRGPNSNKRAGHLIALPSSCLPTCIGTTSAP
jgi:hypothetical protein